MNEGRIWRMNKWMKEEHEEWMNEGRNNMKNEWIKEEY